MWKDKLREASFRGVSFFCDSTGIDGGRRTQTHEFAYRDKPYTEDLGRKAQEFPIEAYVLGDDYMTARDDLLKACNKEGPGELIHPYYGSIQVNCQVINIRESTSEGRIARISLQFIEAGEKFFPESSPDRVAAVESASEELNQTAVDDFADVFSVDGPEAVFLSAIEELEAFSSFAFGSQEDLNVISELSSLIKAPRALALEIQGLIGNLGEIGSKISPLKRLIEACNYGDRMSSTSKSATQTAINSNRNALIDLVRSSSISEAAKVAVETKFETRNEAASVRDSIADAIDSQAEYAEEIPLYLALTDMRVALVQTVPEEGLPELVSISVNKPTSSLVLAYDLYADAHRADEIVSRNNVRHPGFIGPANIQVVSEVSV